MNRKRLKIAPLKRLSCIVVALSVVCMTASQAFAVSSAAALYLRLAAGARPAGMGEAFVGVSDDASATHWNPAGLGSPTMSAVWDNLNIPKEYRPIRSFVPIERGGGYEIWALTAKGLVMYNDGKWTSYHEYEAAPDEDVESILRRYLQSSDDNLIKSAVGKVATLNSKGTLRDLEAFEAEAMSTIPQDSDMRDDIGNRFVTLKKSYPKLLVNWDHFEEVRSRFNSDKSDGKLSSEELDRLSVGLERSVRRYLPEIVKLPYDLNVNAEITCLSGVEKTLWVGTTKGLHSFDGRRWVSYTADDAIADSSADNSTTSSSVRKGLPSNNITCLSVHGKTLIVGTDKGLVGRYGIGWDQIGGDNELPAGAVSAVSMSDEKNGWAVVDGDIYRLSEGHWRNYYDFKISLDESAEQLAENFAIYHTDSEKEKFLARLRELNGVPEGEPLSFNLGQLIKAPYTAEMKGSITALHYSQDRLWVGTEEGLLVFDGKSWSRPGYRPYTTERPMTVTEIALDVARGDSARALTVAAKIREHNDLSYDNVEQGTTLYVYRNIAGLRINDIQTVDGAVYVASARGALISKGDGRLDYFSSDGLSQAETIAVANTDQSLWFATSDRTSSLTEPPRQLMLQHSKWLPELASDLSFNFVSYTQNFKNVGTFGFSLSYFDYGTVTRTDPSGNVTGTESPADFAFALSYGTPISKNTSVGATFKFLRSNLASVGAGLEVGDGKATGFAFDMGVLHRFAKSLSVGAALTNLGPNLSYVDAAQSDPLPLNLAVGLAWNPWSTEMMDMLFVGDVNNVLVEDKLEPVFNVGAELMYADFIAVRAGRIHDDAGDIKAWTFGAGLRLKIPGLNVMPIDFAYIPSSDDLALSNTIRPSITLVF